MVGDVFQIVGTTQAGSFRVEQPVAEGGFAVVYRAFHHGFRGPVALKCLKIPDEMSRDQRGRFLEKFRTEAELLFRLSAAIPEIVRPLQIHLLDVPDGRFVPFLALEWLDGEPLDRIIDRRTTEGKAPFGIREIVPLLTPIARALSRAHSFPGANGPVAVVHCDLKPENIFVAQAGGEQQLKLVDFGIATARSAATQAAMTDEGGAMIRQSSPSSTAMAFSPQYASPEQWSPGEFGGTGPWTDVYGLALTLVEALIGRPALIGDVEGMRRAALDPERRPSPKAYGLHLGQNIDRVFERALAVDPRVRIREISEFWGDLERAIGVNPSLRTTGAPISDNVRRERERTEREALFEAPVERLAVEIESTPSVRAPRDHIMGELDSFAGQAPPPKLAVDLALDRPPPSARSGRFDRADLRALTTNSVAPPPTSTAPSVDLPIPIVVAAGVLVLLAVVLFVMGSIFGIAPLVAAIGVVVWHFVSQKR